MSKSAMRLVLLLLVISTHISFAQLPPLDYSGYHIAFEDHFDYPDPNGKYPSMAFKSYSQFIANWSIDPQYPCSGWGNEVFDASQVSMPRYGIIRLREDTASFPNCTKQGRGWAPLPANHLSGLLSSNFFVSPGIIEASIKLPSGTCDSGCNDGGITDTAAWPAFWIYPNGTAEQDNEIDIIDNDDPDDKKVTSRVFLSVKDQPQQYYETNARPGAKLSAGFHKYSCLWTESRISFYMDERFLGYIDYKDGQTYSALHHLLFTLQTHKTTASGLTMDIDWFKFWVKD